MASNGSTGKAHRRHWSEAEARAVLEELSSSGESTGGFARRKGLSRHRLEYWRQRLQHTKAPEFVAVPLPPAAPAFVEIVAAGVIVRVREECGVDDIARLAVAIGRLAERAC